ncbi:hypothetical protein Leryth_026844 [Lithospermum erythrorhizon]|nr:hypothetical protein Leryth_026844 [Lithospermum erythrorhizon]
MIQPQTYLNVADNSGARELMCIRIIGASNRRYAHIGDVIVAVIKEAVPNMPLERSEVVRAVIVRTCKELKRDNDIRVGWFWACRYFWIQGYKKGDAVCCSNRSGKCYSYSSRSRYATSRSHDKRPWSRKRRSITSYS